MLLILLCNFFYILWSTPKVNKSLKFSLSGDARNDTFNSKHVISNNINNNLYNQCLTFHAISYTVTSNALNYFTSAKSFPFFSYMIVASWQENLLFISPQPSFVYSPLDSALHTNINFIKIAVFKHLTGKKILLAET